MESGSRRNITSRFLVFLSACTAEAFQAPASGWRFASGLSKGLAGASGWNLRREREPHCISRFRRSKEQPRHMNPKRARILMLEDNAADVYLFRKALEDANVDFELTVFKDGGQALEFVRGEGPSGEKAPDL